MSNLTTVDQSKGGLIEQVLIKGDLSSLTAEQRSSYYMKVCDSVGLNMLTKPFEYITLNGKLTLYALRSCTDQLRSIYKVSVEEMVETEREGVFIVTAKVRNAEGRTDIAKGAVNIAGLKGETLANALMKAETKAKRRATLSICGLGMLDETEVETIPQSNSAPYDVDSSKAASPFKTATLRNQFQKNIIESFDACQTIADLNTIIELSKERFGEMKASGDERDTMSIDEIQKRYKLRLVQLKTPETVEDESEAEVAPAFDDAYKNAIAY